MQESHYLTCADCGQENGADSKFCSICAVPWQPALPVPLTCADCGQENEAGSKFCRACGSAPGNRRSGTPDLRRLRAGERGWLKVLPQLRQRPGHRRSDAPDLRRLRAGERGWLKVLPRLRQRPGNRRRSPCRRRAADISSLPSLSARERAGVAILLQLWPATGWRARSCIDRAAGPSGVRLRSAGGLLGSCGWVGCRYACRNGALRAGPRIAHRLLSG